MLQGKGRGLARGSEGGGAGGGQLPGRFSPPPDGAGGGRGVGRGRGGRGRPARGGPPPHSQASAWFRVMKSSREVMAVVDFIFFSAKQ